MSWSVLWGTDVDAFFSPPSFAQCQLAPDGQRYGAKVRYDDFRYALVLVNLADGTQQTLIKEKDLSVNNFWWKNDRWLLVLMETEEGQRFFRSVDLEQLASHELTCLDPYPMRQVVHFLADDSTEVLFRGQVRNTQDHNLVKVDLAENTVEVVAKDPGGVTEWFVGPDGEVIAAWGNERMRHFIAVPREDGAKFERTFFEKGAMPPFSPLGVAPDGRRLVVVEFNSENNLGLAYWDPDDGGLQRVAKGGAFYPQSLELWGYHAVTGGTVKLAGTGGRLLLPEAQGADIWAWLKRALPGTNLEVDSFSADGTRAIAFAGNSTNPGVYCLLELKEKKLRLIGPVKTGLDPKAMVPSEVVVMPTRGGGQMLGELWLPAETPQAPLVLWVGPSLRPAAPDQAFSGFAQYLVSEGFAVARVHHRGGLGRDLEFMFAGDLQAAAGIVEDLEDAVTWITQHRPVDAKRIGIIGDGVGGIPAAALVARRGIGDVFIDLSMPLETSGWRLDRWAPSGRLEEDVEAALGGWAEMRRLIKEADPVGLLESIQVPSLHCRMFGASKVQSILKGRPAEFEILAHPSRHTRLEQDIPYWRLLVSEAEATVSFLRKHL